MPESLNLFNICSGAVPELFERELREVFENIADVNTQPTKTRKIILAFDIKPFPDRSGASVSLQCKSTLGAVDAIEGNVYCLKKDGKIAGIYPRDVRQEMLFPEEKKLEANVIPMSS